MCLLNGDISGNLPYQVDFGKELVYTKDDSGKIISSEYIDIPIKNIIREAVQVHGKELAEKIIIRDIDDYGYYLMEYRGKDPIYYIYNYDSQQVETATFNAGQSITLQNGGSATVGSIKNYETLVTLTDGTNTTADKIKFSETGNTYTVIKNEFGSTMGYRLTPLTYAGDLIANIGDSLTSVLDKIKTMLSAYEYFYDIDGNFIFQKKKTYIDVAYNGLKTDGNIEFADAFVNNNSITYNFSGNKLISSFSNQPNILNIKNDYSIWGKRKGIGGAEIPLHLRYAIDTKPTSYTTVAVTKEEAKALYKQFPEVYVADSEEEAGEKYSQESKTYTTDEYDWRELIYQMQYDYYRYYHSDDFLYKVAQANKPLYPDGKTGYEQYYIDIQGFWRYLYCPKEDRTNNSYGLENIKYDDDYWNVTINTDPQSLPFWFDFMDDTGEMNKYSVSAIGTRSVVVNDDKIKSVYYKDTPNVLIEYQGEEIYQGQTGYVYIKIPASMEKLFTVSSQGESAIARLNNMLFDYTYAADNVSMNCVPVYFLNPNTIISVFDENSGINGEYIVSRLTIPLQYNGMMSITASKVPAVII